MTIIAGMQIKPISTKKINRTPITPRIGAITKDEINESIIENENGYDKTSSP